VNWLGERVRAMINDDDVVLDLGCGIGGATGRLGAVHVGVDVFRPYLDSVKREIVVIEGLLPQCMSRFLDDSFDVVLMLDVLEHMQRSQAMFMLEDSKRVARRSVIAFTPEGFMEQDEEVGGLAPWGFNANEHQRHLCGLYREDFTGWEIQSGKPYRGCETMLCVWAQPT